MKENSMLEEKEKIDLFFRLLEKYPQFFHESYWATSIMSPFYIAKSASKNFDNLYHFFISLQVIIIMFISLSEKKYVKAVSKDKGDTVIQISSNFIIQIWKDHTHTHTHIVIPGYKKCNTQWRLTQTILQNPGATNWPDKRWRRVLRLSDWQWRRSEARSSHVHRCLACPVDGPRLWSNAVTSCWGRSMPIASPHCQPGTENGQETYKYSNQNSCQYVRQERERAS